jgi:hypothetical protein
MIFYATEGSMFSLHFGSFQSLDFTKKIQITKKENNYKIYHQQKEKISHKHKDFIWLFLHRINPLPQPFIPLWYSTFGTTDIIINRQISQMINNRFHPNASTSFFSSHNHIHLLGQPFILFWYYNSVQDNRMKRFFILVHLFFFT